MLDAVVRTGGKQYRVHEGSVLNVASLDAEPGSEVELRDVLLVSDDGSVTLGSPNVPDAVVVAEVVEHGKGKKVISFKYKAKVRYRRKRGHRQPYTRLEVREIRIGDKTSSRASRRAAPAAETGPAEETAAPRRRARRATEPEAQASTPSRRRRPRTEAEQEGGFLGREE